MAKLTSLPDLTRVREQARQDLKTRSRTGTTIAIGMGTCGVAAGARETMQAIEQELARRQIDANITTVGCIGMCVKEPLVDVQQAGRSHVLYGNIKPDMVPRLIADHLVKGQPVNQWVVCRIPVE